MNLSRFLKTSVCLRSQKVSATWRGFYISSLSSSSVKLVGIYWLSQSRWQKLSWLLMILNRSSPWARRIPSGVLFQVLAKAKLFGNVSQIFFFLPFLCQLPPNALCGQHFLPFVCMQNDSFHGIIDKFSLFLLSVKIFGKLFSPEDSYNQMFFTHDFM